ncbi:hypothetical protein [Lacrimispora indolis]|uniref:hypothetical protein n=1 Tax=Lacrimispora indolis TaxID=69825 RepID=UPI000462D827|nr:hypothetical protein [[Clostridium] methoxybenzovorans]
MENIALNNGQTVLIGSNKDIIEAIETHCSYELASLISAKLIDIDAEKLYAQERAQTDADSYLSDLESKECCLRDVLEIAEGLTDYIEEAKRINKDMIYQKLNEIIKHIGNEL